MYSTWDFTVAEDRSLDRAPAEDPRRRVRAARRHEPGGRRDPGPRAELHGHEVQDFTPAQNAKIARKITGTFVVPCYLDRPGCPPGSRYHYSSSKHDALPTQIAGNVDAGELPVQHPARRFTRAQRASRSTGTGCSARTRRSRREHQGHERGARLHVLRHRLERDGERGRPERRSTISATSRNFPSLADRLQQGILNTLYLGRLLAHPQGFAANAASRAPAASGCWTPPTSTSTRTRRARSSAGSPPPWHRTGRARCSAWRRWTTARCCRGRVDFDTYNVVFEAGLPDGGTRLVLISLVQMLWDRGETDGWALPRDHQAAREHAQAHGAHARRGGRPPGGQRHVGRRGADDRRVGVPAGGGRRAARSTGRRCSGSRHQGLPVQRLGDRLLGRGPADPAGARRSTSRTAAASTRTPSRATPWRPAHQKSAFLSPNGAVIDVCGGQPCRTDNYK